MGSRHLDYPSPRGVHVPEKYALNEDPYRRYFPASPRRNRYSHSTHQTPRIRDVTWITSTDPTPPTPQAPASPWLPPPGQAPSTPARRPPSPIPPSPAPTVGEHMTVDDIVHMPHEHVAFRPQRQGGGGRFLKSLWKGLKKLSGYQPMSMPAPYFPGAGSYEARMMEMPAPGLSVLSDSTQSQYVDPTPPETDPQQGMTPYASPYARSANLGATPARIPRSLRGSPAPGSMPSPAGIPRSLRGSPAPPPAPIPSPSLVSVPRSLRPSSAPSPMPSLPGDMPPPITIVSPSIPPSPLPRSIRSMRNSAPGRSQSNLSVRMPEPVPPPPVEDGSQTLHEPVFPEPIRPPPPSGFALPPPVDDPKLVSGHKSLAFDLPSSSQGSTMARLRRFVAGVDGLPWVSDSQIADEYIPERNPRSRMRTKVRQGAEPSWYNPRPEVEERPEYWSQWDMWAMQSAAELWRGGAGQGHMVGWGGVDDAQAGMPVVPGQWGMPAYPAGYVPAQPGFVYPSGYPPPGMVTDTAPVIP